MLLNRSDLRIQPELTANHRPTQPQRHSTGMGPQRHQIRYWTPGQCANSVPSPKPEEAPRRSSPNRPFFLRCSFRPLSVIRPPRRSGRTWGVTGSSSCPGATTQTGPPFLFSIFVPVHVNTTLFLRFRLDAVEATLYGSPRCPFYSRRTQRSATAMVGGYRVRDRSHAIHPRCRHSRHSLNRHQAGHQIQGTMMGQTDMSSAPSISSQPPTTWPEHLGRVCSGRVSVSVESVYGGRPSPVRGTL